MVIAGKSLRAFLIATAGLLLVWSLTACGADSDGEAPPPTRTLVPPTAPPTVTPTSPIPTPTDLPAAKSFAPAQTPVAAPGLPDDLRAALQQAVDDWVASGAVTRREVRVLSLERFRWSDASLGCAEPAGSPAEIEGGVEGYRILLAGSRAAVAYHTGGGALVRCPPGGLAAGLHGEPVAPDPIAQAMVDLVRRDWSEQISAEAGSVEVVGLVSVIWPDASLGCPKAAGPYPAQEMPGYRVVLRQAEREAIYHTSIRDFIRCAPDEEVLPGVLIEALATPAAAISAPD